MQNNFIIGENCYKQKIIFDPRDFVGESILKEGIYDKTGLYFIEKVLSQLNDPIAFDIGANIGNHALRMSEHAKTVYLFEPQAHIVEHLNTTMQLNQITNWKIFNFGLSDEEATLPLYKRPDGVNCTNSFVSDAKEKNYASEKAQVFIGDKVISDNGIDRLDFLKIDVEGFEAKVILGLKNSILKFRPIIFMEWDKAITKQQFQEFGLFNTIFGDYIVKALKRNPNESIFYKKIVGKIRRLFNKTLLRKKFMIGEFTADQDYRHIIFIPKEKVEILNVL